jgi:hypothetical protein
MMAKVRMMRAAWFHLQARMQGWRILLSCICLCWDHFNKSTNLVDGCSQRIRMTRIAVSVGVESRRRAYACPERPNRRRDSPLRRGRFVFHVHVFYATRASQSRGVDTYGARAEGLEGWKRPADRWSRRCKLSHEGAAEAT